MSTRISPRWTKCISNKKIRYIVITFLHFQHSERLSSTLYDTSHEEGPLSKLPVSPTFYPFMRNKLHAPNVIGNLSVCRSCTCQIPHWGAIATRPRARERRRPAAAAAFSCTYVARAFSVERTPPTPTLPSDHPA